MADLSLASVNQPPERGGGSQAGNPCLLAVCPLVSGIPCSQGNWQHGANYCFFWL